MERSIASVDQNWAIVVITGCLFLGAFVSSIPPTFGVQFAAIARNLGLSDLEISWVFNMYGVFYSLMLFVCNPLCHRFGVRKTCFVASVILSAGYSSLRFALSAFHLAILFSVIVGMSSGVVFYSTFFILPLYFVEKRDAALSLNYTAVAVGKIFVPHITYHLQKEFGHSGGVFLYGALLLNCCVASVLFRPPLQRQRQHRLLQENEFPKCSILPKGESLENGVEKTSPSVFEDIKITLLESLKVFQSWRVVVNSLGIGLYMMSYNNFTMVIPFSLEERGYSDDSASWCISYSAMSNFALRLLMTLLTDKKWFNARVFYMIGSSMAGIFTLGFAYASNLNWLCLSMVIWGAGLGITMSLWANVLRATTETPYPPSLAASGLLISAGYIVAAPLFGSMRPKNGSYTGLIVMAGVFQALPAVLHLCMPMARRRDESY